MTKHSVVPAVLLGCAIGDALGMPFEMRGNKIHPELKGWDGELRAGKHHELPAGHYTDDTEMSIALANSLVANGKWDREATAANYLAWSQDTPHGMGGTVRAAMRHLKEWAGEEGADGRMFSGQHAKNQSAEEVGSGTVMRCAPIGVFFAGETDMIRVVCKSDAYITHAHPEAYAASLAVASLIAGIILEKGDRGNSLTFMYEQLCVVDPDSLTRKALPAATGHQYLPEDFVTRVGGRFGNAWQIATSAISCAYRYWSNFEKGVQEAVRLGGDTDTRAAVTGAILGAVHGIEGMPTKYSEHVLHHASLRALDNQLHQAIRKD